MPYSYRYLRARRRWLVVLALLVILLIHAAITARLFLSPEQVRFRIQTLLEEQSPGKASVGAAGYELPFGVRLGDIELYRAEEDGGELFFRAKALRVRGLPLALFRGKVALDDLVFEEPELRVAPQKREPEKPEREPPELPVRRIIWRGGTLHFQEGALYEDSPAQSLRAVNVEFKKVLRLENAFGFEGSADSDLWGRCDLEGLVDLMRQRLDATLVARGIPVGAELRELLAKSARTGAIARAVDRYGLKGVVDLRVQASADRRAAAPPAVKATIELRDCEATWQRLPLAISDLCGLIVYDGANVYYRDIQGRAGSSTLELSGRSTDLGDPAKLKVHTDLVVRDRELDDVLYAAVSQYIHPRVKRPVLKDTWDRIGIQGGVFDLEYHSTWWQAGNRHQGKALARVRKASATYSKLPYPLTDIAGTIRWEQGTTYIDNLTGRRGTTIVHLSGSVTDKGVPDLRIQALDVPFDKVLHDALMPRWRQTYDELRPEGKGAADVQVTCPSRDPSKLVYRIAIRPEGASFHHKDSRYRIDDVWGEILVDETGSVSFRGLRGKLGDIPVKLLGTIAASDGGPVLDITVVAEEVELGPRTRALLTPDAAKVYDQLEPLGKVRVAWRLWTDRATGKQRNTTHIQCAGDCSIRHRLFPLRVEGLMGGLTVEGSGRTTFRGVQGRIGRAAIEALEGAYSPDKQGLRFTLRARGLALDDALRRALPEAWQKAWDGVRPAGEADVEYQYRHNPDDAKLPLQRVIVEPAGGSFCSRQLPLKVADVSRGVITFDERGNVKINNVLGKYRGRAVAVSGQVKAGPEGSTLTLDVSAAELALDQELRAALAKEWQPIFDRLHLAGTIGADAHIRLSLATGKVEDFTLDARLKGCEATWEEFPIRVTGLRGSVGYARGVATMTDVVGQSAVAEEVRLEGQVAEAKAKAPTRLRIRGRNLRLEPELLKALPAQVREAIDAIAFKGAADIDVTVTREGNGKEPTRSFGVVTLRNCSFKRRYPFEGVSGEVRIDRGEVGPDGAHAFSGGLHLDTLVVRKLPITGLRGQFAYRLAGKDGSPRLTLSALDGSFCGGRVTGEVEVGLGEESAFRGVLRASGVDFKKFCVEAVRTKYRASGVFDLRLEIPPGTYKGEKGLVGDGWASVTRGELGELPLAVALFSLLRLAAPERSLTSADMKFAIAEDHLVIKELLLGRERKFFTAGSGTVGFDGKLDLNFVAPKSGFIEHIVNLPVEALVRYEVHGTLADPKPTARPLPLTKTLFDQFRRGFGIWQALTGSGRSREKDTPP